MSCSLAGCNQGALHHDRKWSVCIPFFAFWTHKGGETSMHLFKRTHQIRLKGEKMPSTHRELLIVNEPGMIPECSLISSSPCVISPYSSVFVFFWGQKSAVLPGCICCVFTKPSIRMQTVEEQILWAQFRQTPYSVPLAVCWG